MFVSCWSLVPLYREQSQRHICHVFAGCLAVGLSEKHIRFIWQLDYQNNAPSMLIDDKLPGNLLKERISTDFHLFAAEIEIQKKRVL